MLDSKAVAGGIAIFVAIEQRRQVKRRRSDGIAVVADSLSWLIATTGSEPLPMRSRKGSASWHTGQLTLKNASSTGPWRSRFGERFFSTAQVVQQEFGGLVANRSILLSGYLIPSQTTKTDCLRHCG